MSTENNTQQEKSLAEIMRDMAALITEQRDMLREQTEVIKELRVELNARQELPPVQRPSGIGLGVNPNAHSPTTARLPTPPPQ